MSCTPGSFDHLQPELWQHIISFVYRPPPEKQFFSGGFGRLRQPDLATLMRVSADLNTLTAPRLYRKVITDDLVLLTAGLGSPSASPAVSSKRALLASITSLHLEYSDKQSSPSYSSLLEYGDWERVADRDQQDCPRDAKSPQRFKVGCQRDGHRLNDGLQAIVSAGASKQIFKPTKRVTLGAYLGGQTDIWNRHETMPSDFQISLMLLEMVAAPSIIHACQQGSTGPLSIRIALNTPKRQLTNYTVHFTLDDLSLPTIPGEKVRWLLEARYYHEFMKWGQIAAVVVNLLAHQKYIRSLCADAKGVLSDTRLLLDIAASSKTPLDLLIFTGVWPPLGELPASPGEVTRWLREKGGLAEGDQVNWTLSGFDDICKACSIDRSWRPRFRSDPHARFEASRFD